MPQVAWALTLAFAALRAEPGDVEGARDYPTFPRVAGFVISDYDEDKPAAFEFPVSRPLPTDADHMDAIRIRGHRYIIRYEPGPGARIPTLFQTQQYYEKLATDGGYTIEKSGAVGSVAETFHKKLDDRDIWVYLEPAVTANSLTVVETPVSAPKLAVEPPTIGPTPPSPEPATKSSAVPVPLPPITTDVGISPPKPTPTPVAPSPTPAPAPQVAVVDPNDDSLYQDLSKDGRVVVPFVFRPGREDLDSSSQSLVDRVVTMMKKHPDLFLRIEGHTDNSGDPEVNMRLSTQRAFSVQSALIEARVEKKRLDAVGVGGLQPRSDNNTASGRDKNRRIELVMWKKYPALHQNPVTGKQE